MENCLVYPDFYGIISCLPYFIFGLLGLLVNNSFLNDIHSYLIVLGIGGMIDYSGSLPGFIQICLTLCSGMITLKISTEIIKQIIRNRLDERENLGPFAFDRLHRHPVSIISLCTIIYICLTIYYKSIYSVIVLLILNQIIANFLAIKFFKQKTANYTKTRHMILKTTIATIFGCIGHGTSQLCFGSQWNWARLFIGTPIGNFCLAYTFFIQSQLALLMRGKNIHRKVKIRGSDYIYIAYYIGRLSPTTDSED